ncbi:hypothetical protein [Ensifer sp. BR816]|uniref:hypothetical protein n=1 Tax=Rhizobium sp. (strain BR816) TaxID=1057002 RepID=UPI00036FBA9A|nr:hypothetical protein [Ensifer sp. BR816]
MRSRNTLVPASGRQLDLIFKTRMLDGLSDKDRKKAISTLACLLMQAAGLVVEEFNDERNPPPKAVCPDLLIGFKSMAYVMRYNHFPH